MSFCYKNAKNTIKIYKYIQFLYLKFASYSKKTYFCNLQVIAWTIRVRPTIVNC